MKPMQPTVNQHILLNVPSDAMLMPPDVSILSPIHIMAKDQSSELINQDKFKLRSPSKAT